MCPRLFFVLKPRGGWADNNPVAMASSGWSGDVLRNPPVLTSATYETDAAVTLTFDRPVDISGILASFIVVDDGQFTNTRYEGGGAELAGAASVWIELVPIGAASGGTVRLMAGAGNGIVATADGAAWAGVSDVALPFP